MRWLLVVGIAVALGLLTWLGVTVRERAERERRALEQQSSRNQLTKPEAEREDKAIPATPSTGRLEGTIKGRYGGIWGVRVAALETGTGTVLGEAYTGTDGYYKIELPKDTVVDVVVEPAGETGLPRRQRDGVRVPDVVDLAFAPRTEVTGQLQWEGATPIDFIEVTAIRARDWREVDHPVLLRRAVVDSARVWSDGKFRFVGLPKGEYRLVLQCNNWMLSAPVVFRDDSVSISGVAVRAWSVRLRVEESVLRLPVDRFRVVMYFGGGVVLRWEGRDGRITRRVRHPMGADWKPQSSMTEQYTEIVAPGYKDERRPIGLGMNREGAETVLLESSRSANAHVTVEYDNGKPFHGHLDVIAVCPDHGAADLSIQVRRGQWQCRFPAGRWVLQFSRHRYLMDRGATVELDLSEAGAARGTVVIRRGGALILTGEDGALASVVHVVDGQAMSRRLVAVGTTRLPAGRYRVEDATGTTLIKEIEIVPGGRRRVSLRP